MLRCFWPQHATLPPPFRDSSLSAGISWVRMGGSNTPNTIWYTHSPPLMRRTLALCISHTFPGETSRYLPCVPVSRACSGPLSRAAPSLNQPGTTGGPSPCVSRRGGDPAFTPMKRSVRLGFLLFLARLIACHSTCESVPPRAMTLVYFRIQGAQMRVPVSSLRAWCGGCGRHRTELGFDSPSLTLRTGLAEREHTCLLCSSALSACCCSLRLSPPGKPLSWRSCCSQPPLL